MRKFVVPWKEVGQTPLEAIEIWKRENPEYANIPASYAGRLDPMAQGKLLVLLGDECKRQKEYHGLDKEYEIEVLLDLSSDTGDVLSIPSYGDTESFPITAVIRAALNAEIGTRLLPYPVFSSKTVRGKPLFMYALEGTLDTITIPEHEETIHSIRLVKSTNLAKSDLKERIDSLLTLAPRSDDPSKILGADFRQDAIRKEWDQVFEQMPDRTFAVLTLRVRCGSGTYMRTLANRIGTTLDTTALALSITRTRVGRYLPRLHIWLRQF